MWVLIPLKNFVDAKLRLSGMLSAAERRGLVQAMVEDVLAVVVAEPSLKGVVLLSDDPSAGLLAGHFGVQCWSERALGAVGLNGVVSAGVSRLAAQGADAVMVVHGDIPLMDGGELAQLLDSHRSRFGPRVTIAPDRHGDGSNIVLCSPPQVMAFAYGENSCHAHRRNADNSGASCEVLPLPGVGRDIDNADDLLALLHPRWRDRAGGTLKYLHDSGIGRRLRAIAAGGANAEFNQSEVK